METPNHCSFYNTYVQQLGFGGPIFYLKTLSVHVTLVSIDVCKSIGQYFGGESYANIILNVH